jgi:hypothetical protein
LWSQDAEVQPRRPENLKVCGFGKEMEDIVESAGYPLAAFEQMINLHGLSAVSKMLRTAVRMPARRSDINHYAEP